MLGRALVSRGGPSTVALALAVALLGAAGAAVALADVATPVPNEPYYFVAVSCADAGDQNCGAITRPNVLPNPPPSQLVPISGGSAGTPVDLPSGFQASGLDCQSATTCVIVGDESYPYPTNGSLPKPDEAAVVSVSNGVVGSPQLVPVTVGSNSGLAGVACSGESSCVAVGPLAGGAQGTSPAYVVPINNGVPDPAQSVPGAHQLSGVACSDLTHCVAVGNNNSVQVVVSITDGNADPAQPVAGTSLNDTLEGVACVPGTTSCVAIGARVAVPISHGAPGATVSVANQQGGVSSFFDGISCANTSGCVASGELASDTSDSGVILPVGLDGTPGVMRTEPGTSFLRGIECADPLNCIAVGAAKDNGGVIVQVHQSPVSPSAAVSSALTVSGAASSIRAILKAGGYPATFTAPKPGKVQVSWYYLPPGAHLAKVTRPVLVAHGSKQFTAPGQATIKIALTAQGRSRLKKAKRVKLTALGSFIPKGGKPTTKRKVITLKPH